MKFTFIFQVINIIIVIMKGGIISFLCCWSTTWTDRSGGTDSD